jgi:NADH-quinone oxidoreductase subunit J
MPGNIAEVIYSLTFYGLALIAVVAAIIVISARNVVVSAIWLVVCFVAVAGIYALLNAPFLMAAQILVYAGAVMVLFVMLIMLMDIGRFEPGTSWQTMIRSVSAAIGVVIMMALMVLLSLSNKVEWPGLEKPEPGTIEKIGEVLFTKYLLPFEVLSLLLVAAVVAALYLARRPEGKE